MRIYASETKKTIDVFIIDDLFYEEDQHFYIRLFNPRVMGNKRRKISIARGLVNPDAYQIPSLQVSQTSSSNHSSTFVSYEMTKDGLPIATILDRNEKRIRRSSCITPPSNIFEGPVIRRSSCITPPSIVGDERPVRRSSCITPPNSNLNRIEPIVGPIRRQACITPPSTTHLTVPGLLTSTAEDPTDQVEEQDSSLRLVCPSLATVLIMDDDHHGIFTLSKSEIEIKDSVTCCVMQIIRCGGTRSSVELSYRTEDGTASAGRDYQTCSGKVVFEDGQVE